MTTDFQQGRVTLGARLRELRIEAGLTGRELAARCGWPHSKVSKLENGRQTAASADLKAWASAIGRSDVTSELLGRLRGLEMQYRSWRRQLAAGHRAVQENAGLVERRSRTIHGFESGIIPGLFQTADYARHVLMRYADLHGVVGNVEEGVRARLARQSILKERGRSFRFIVWEGALRVRLCPPDVMLVQLEHLVRLLRTNTVSLGVIPFEADVRVAPDVGFWIHDERLVVTEIWNAEIWLDGADDVALYSKVWDTLNEAAVYEAEAHRLILRSQRALCLSSQAKHRETRGHP
ncbi:helix-turn-helix transcriptional regulator [Streptomyces sp. ET3-23]|uniref:helix-turn-helix domain-containing protein n=1 Tax=Streptomyces sp. ET3-23 TaxID=2885643 RepID=UPI001D100679|nr:helix-turn-helix transcriptional regulator [Streptomyces sp. ET3-23]MCC2279665.1 helix-turn-helix transcriptional regulator [Streptomyces sp. ET3-23]